MNQVQKHRRPYPATWRSHWKKQNRFVYLFADDERAHRILFGVVPTARGLILLLCIFCLKWLLHTTLIPAKTMNTFLCWKNNTLYIIFLFVFFLLFFLCLVFFSSGTYKWKTQKIKKTQAVLIFSLFLELETDALFQFWKNSDKQVS